MMLRLCLELEEPGGVHMEPVFSSPVLGSDRSVISSREDGGCREETRLELIVLGERD